MPLVSSRMQPQKAWAGAIAAPAQEFSLTPLKVLAGHLPTALQGCLYRNGPARLARQGHRVGHWFDGDGAVLAVHFAAGQAQATYRYVRSAGYVEEATTERFLFRGYGSLPPGPWWSRWRAQVKNAANTSVLALPDRLLALWEGGWPHRLDLTTLTTQGVDDLGQLGPNEPYSAHPKRHPRTGHLFNFGVVAGANATLNLYRSDPSGRIEKQQSIPLNGTPLIHDFVLADRYLVFCVPPVRLNALPAVLGLQSFSDSLMWQPRQGTQIVVVDADSLEAISLEAADPWYQWHFGKGFVNQAGDIILEVVRYPDFATNRRLQEVASGHIQTAAPGQLWRLCIDPQTARLRSQTCLVAISCEFPQVPATPAVAAAPTYFTAELPGTDNTGELFRAIGCFEPDTAAVTLAPAGLDKYPSEPIYVPNPSPATGGWILTVVYDGGEHQSEVWIYDSDRLTEAPICRLRLPQVIPHSFHGTWRAAP